MNEQDHNVIVVGAGLAGLSCAAELTLHGLRPLLVCETGEVGSVFSPKQVGDSRGFVQHATWQHGAGGGWWYQQARQLNLPIRFYPGLSFSATVRGSGSMFDIPMSPSPAGLTALITQVFPLPMTDAQLADFEAVMRAALAIPYPDLVMNAKWQEMPIRTWLEDLGVDQMISLIVLQLCGTMWECTVPEVSEHISVFGALILLRSVLCGELQYFALYPNVQEGLCIPLADEIERRGGTVRRKAKVDRVLIDGGRARGVRLADGTELFAPRVAIATGNPRIPDLFYTIPEEIREPLERSQQMAKQDFTLYAELDRPIVTREYAFHVITNADGAGATQWMFPLHRIAPWTTPSGKQLICSQQVHAPEHAAALGGPDAIYAQMHEVIEEIYPGYQESISAVATQQHRHNWMSQAAHWPRIPRTIPSVDGLWFVGDGSAPCQGLFMEAAASCGILGARQMAGE
jgi:hypothetical protein